MKFTPVPVLLVVMMMAVFITRGHCAESEEDPATVTVEESESDEPLDQEKMEYAKGSVCQYCSYCKFCKLCDQDCPCEKSKTKPNCDMCKYCKFCYLCSAFCDTVCSAGGILDRVSASIVNSLPSFNKDEVDEDIDAVKYWIDKKKDEL
ncbi:sarcoplasmic reticulum histidine-rich calcium-binding protein-like [Elysia marginata]|uniref:Sarcoplasmic reticulum histidine-rich calcium-binding protein-like n=1 Tax=Elysia marginata TaxID=1093978 RepID=A0AAV4IQY1_9GAST|nr:sarcoplasmic reticulum histidine-rich calcium-binding protein-like [Elysia marginata]